MYLEETSILPIKIKKNEGEGEAIKNSLGSALKLNSNLKGMRLKFYSSLHIFSEESNLLK